MQSSEKRTPLSTLAFLNLRSNSARIKINSQSLKLRSTGSLARRMPKREPASGGTTFLPHRSPNLSHHLPLLLPLNPSKLKLQLMFLLRSPTLRWR
jgi:hypothetical protein